MELQFTVRLLVNIIGSPVTINCMNGDGREVEDTVTSCTNYAGMVRKRNS